MKSPNLLDIKVALEYIKKKFATGYHGNETSGIIQYGSKFVSSGAVRSSDVIMLDGVCKCLRICYAATEGR